MSQTTAQCDRCGVYMCFKRDNRPEQAGWPSKCPTRVLQDELRQDMKSYEEEPVRKLAMSSWQVNKTGRRDWTRMEATMEFAHMCGFKHLGIAYCVGLREETRIIANILRDNGFQVTSVSCSVGSPRWEEVGIDHPSGACNATGQALVLNAAGTQLNITVGLCVGDDAIFFMKSKAPVTALICKDKLTGHNPIAAIYTAHGYFKERLADHGRP